MRINSRVYLISTNKKILNLEYLIRDRDFSLLFSERTASNQLVARK